jgi:creatinine amidohydrolase
VNIGEPGMHGSIPRDRFLPYLSMPQIQAIDKQHAAVVLLIAAIEQHGLHMPVGTDSIQGWNTLGAALGRLPRDVEVYALPPVAYGKSNEHSDFPGTFWLSAKTMIDVVNDIAKGVAVSGFRRLILFGCHGGNNAIIDVIARDIHIDTGLIVFPLHMLALGARRDQVSDEEASYAMHGGDAETSCMLEHEPSMVSMELAKRAKYRMPEGFGPTFAPGAHFKFAWRTSDLSPIGNIGDPTTATREKGEIIIEREIGRLVDALTKMSRIDFPLEQV